MLCTQVSVENSMPNSGNKHTLWAHGLYTIIDHVYMCRFSPQTSLKRLYVISRPEGLRSDFIDSKKSFSRNCRGGLLIPALQSFESTSSNTASYAPEMRVFRSNMTCGSGLGESMITFNMTV